MIKDGMNHIIRVFSERRKRKLKKKIIKNK